MKLNELLGQPVRTIAYSPELGKLTGSSKATLVLCQLIYWTGKQRDAEGWIQKRTSLACEAVNDPDDPSAQSLAAETGLSYKELKVARRILRERGFLHERHDYEAHLILFKIDIEAIRGAWSRIYGEYPPHGAWADARGQESDVPSVHLENAQRDMSDVPSVHLENAQRDMSDVPSGNLLNGTSIDYAETTSANAREKAKGLEEIQMPPEWESAHGLPVSAAGLARERLRDEARGAFESAFGVNGWPWCSTRVWEKMADLVAGAWQEDHQVFRAYVEWMQDEGKYTAMSTKQIRISPQQFIDTGWPMFQASRRSQEPERVQVESDLERRIREGIGRT